MLVLDTGLVTLRSTLLRVVVFKTGKSDDDTEKILYWLKKEIVSV